MKTLICFFIFMVFSSAYANSIFEKYIGCYRTISVNGQPIVIVPHGIEVYYPTEIRKSTSSLTFDPVTN